MVVLEKVDDLWSNEFQLIVRIRPPWSNPRSLTDVAEKSGFNGSWTPLLLRQNCEDLE